MKRKQLIACGMLGLLLTAGCAGGGTEIYDARGNILGEEYHVYEELVLEEADQILADKEGKYSIYTAFDTSAYQAIQKVYAEYEGIDMQSGCAVTDLHGYITAIYSQNSENQDINYAVEKVEPYGAITPLSVYAPALDGGAVTWSTMYGDTDPMTLCQGIKEESAEVAAACLKDYGVLDSIEFLKDKFAMELSYEEEKVGIAGMADAAEVIAGGSWREGISPVEMAGYYQIFANGGAYAKPRTIVKIVDARGEVVYEASHDMDQVIMKETAYVMNKLLQETENTGANQGSGEEGNWYAGYTPEYSIAIWNDAVTGQKVSQELFTKINKKLGKNVQAAFPEAKTVKEAVYCKETGLMLSESCQKMDLGYYLSLNIPKECSCTQGGNQ